MPLPFRSASKSNPSDADRSGPERLIHRLSILSLSAVAFLVLGIVMVPSGSSWSQAAQISRALETVSSAESATSTEAEPTAAPRVAELASHPSRTLRPYFAPSASNSLEEDNIVRQFHQLLNQYVTRQATDDNFTIRVIDRRSNEVLEVYELAALRSEYEKGDPPNWEEIDARRREAMEELVEKHEKKGVPVEEITVRWGRANQVDLAHRRDRGYQAYERRLAEYLNLSLLATEIGTVETFNRDDRVSGAGARSRYQMLPWVLRRSGVHEYTLPTDGDSWVRVREERNPLLVLEPAFLLLKAYVNAVGHEMPGLSAYHTGPGNVFKLYRQYYAESGHLTTASTVADAYAWAVTEGFQTVSEGSSFGGHSRGYVPALYGSLIAREKQTVNQTPPLRTARVQVKPGAGLELERILATLDSIGKSFDWGPSAHSGPLYQRFRSLNPHIDLPPLTDGTAPDGGNVRFVSSIDGKAVRFFLPIGAPKALRAAGVTALDSSATFQFDASTFAPPSGAQVTRWDRKYEALVDDIEHFGFTERHRDRLLNLHDKFASLAEQQPTRYRRRQLKIISAHRRLWMSNPWDQLADATKRATGRMAVPVQPPETIPIEPVPTRYFPDVELE